jgi:hypothetical protein
MQLFDFRWLARPSGRVISPRIIAIFAANCSNKKLNNVQGRDQR